MMKFLSSATRAILSKLKAFFVFKKWPSKSQWIQLFKILTKKERIIFSCFLFLFLSSSFFLLINFYLEKTRITATDGGVFTEGLVGQPRWIQPIYASANDIDRDLVELIYSGLMKYDEEGKIIPDLAKDYPKISEDGKVFEFYLNDNIFWHDEKPLTADDVIFTIETIQNSNYKSPLRVSWLGVQVEKISDKALRFKLKNSYSSFLENTTLKILPKHIWKDVSPENFPLSIYNLKPVGSGPLKLKGIKQDNSGKVISLTLVKNQNFYKKVPYLNQISFLFFTNEEDLIKAAKSREFQGLYLTSPENLTALKEKGFSDYQLSMPNYFSIFFNSQNSKILSEEEIRKALNYGTNKKEVVEKALSNQGKIIDSPILPEIFGFENPLEIYEFNLDKANEILDKAGFVKDETGIRKKVVVKEAAFKFKSSLTIGSKGTEVEELQKCLSNLPEIYPGGQITGIFGEKTKEAVINFQKKYTDLKGTGTVGSTTRKKLNEICFQPGEEEIVLKFSLTTVDQPVLDKVASLLKEQWNKIGIEIDIKKYNPLDPEVDFEGKILKPRNYQLLLYGEILGSIPDPFPFWHSSQKKDPGLNLAIYENKETDKLLEEARQILDNDKRKEDLEKFQNILIEDAPAIFLYSPDCVYLISKGIKGFGTEMIVDPSKRFIGIENWYLKTKRVWK